jgi:hypothetical protein
LYSLNSAIVPKVKDMRGIVVLWINILR